MSIMNLSFDPRDPYFETPGLAGIQWGIHIFTTSNLYVLDSVRVQQHQQDGVHYLTCEGLAWAGQQKQMPGRVEVRITNDQGAVSWQIQAWHHEPIKSIKLIFKGLPEGPLAQGWWHATMPQGEVIHPTAALPLRWRYPWPEWVTPWACASDAQGGICLSIRDQQVRTKRFYVYLPPYAQGRPIVELLCDQDAAHYHTYFSSPEFRLRLCQNSEEIRTDFDAHLEFLDHAYELPHWENRTDIPAWFHDIRLVVMLHGQHWTGYVFNTFDQMADSLRFVTKHIAGKHILAYLPGWEGRYYFAYPFYQPGEDMGGEAGLRRFLQVAQELGVHVMPMFGANGANIQRYPDWEKSVFRNRTNRYVKLINLPDWDGDREGDDDQIFLNPGEPTYRQHLIEQVDHAITTYGFEGVFLDTSACWFNDPRYNLYDGYCALVSELRDRYPHILIAGEGWWDALLKVFPVNQSWFSVHTNYHFPEILTRYGRALGHLMEGAPGTGSTGVHEAGFRPVISMARPAPGHISALAIVDNTLALYGSEIARLCRAAAAW